MNLKRKVVTALIAGSVMAATLAPAAAFADGSTCNISGNGVLSHNTCVVVKKEKTVRVTINKAKVKNTVVVVQSTGGNTANGNTGGNVTIDSGNTKATVTIVNTVNSGN